MQAATDIGRRLPRIAEREADTGIAARLLLLLRWGNRRRTRGKILGSGGTDAASDGQAAGGDTPYDLTPHPSAPRYVSGLSIKELYNGLIP